MATIDDLASTVGGMNVSVNSSSQSSLPIDLSTNTIDTDHASNNCSVPADLSKSSLESSFHLPDTLSSSLITPSTDDQQTATTDDDDKDQFNPPLSTQVSCNGKTSNGDGSDSGVDIEGNSTVTGGSSMLQRALSSTSGGYSSSCGGIDEPVLGHLSCSSSIISYCSEQGEIRSPNTVLLHHSSNQDCTSEGGSESSSITGGPVNRKASVVRKKVALIEPAGPKSIGKKEENSVARSRSRAASASRAAFQSKLAANSPPLPISPQERARSRDKALPPFSKTAATTPSRSTPLKRPVKPDSLPSGAHPLPSLQRSNSTRTPSVSCRTPSATPTVEDGRWPSASAKPTTPITPKPNGRAGSSTPEHLIIKTKLGSISLDAKSPTGDKFATLPRRRKEKSTEDLRSSNNRSNSATRDRMSTSLIKRKESTPPKLSVLSTPIRRATTTKPLPKIKIYHETCVQTALTCQDIENAFAGIAIPAKEVEAIEMVTRECQVDIRDKQIERLQEQLCRMTRDVNNLQGSLTERSAQLANVEQQLIRERDEKQAMTKELQSNTQRILGMLANMQDEQVAATDAESNCDSLLMLESQIQQSGHALEAKQCEIDKMYSFCRKLQAEMHRSMSVQQTLQDEKMEFEKESSELQDFLQDEKSALVDALREAEVECEKSAKALKKKDNDIERLQEECRHLVRISEQRRHEFLGMQSKYTALESRSKDLIIQQGSAVSGASMALTGLGTRLDQLVEQLIQSYSISEQELEDVIYHNEAYTNSGGSSGQVSPDREHAAPLSEGALSPQRHQSFIVAVISAIRNAATNAKHSVVQPSVRREIAASATTATIDETGEESDSTEMLESETEPCLMMENVLEDVSMPDTHSHNMVSSTGLILSGPHLMSLSQQASVDEEAPVDDEDVAEMNREEKSIHNLSQAILNRQQIEQQTNRIIRHNSIEQCTMSEELSSSGHEESIAEMPSMVSEFCCAQPLVDQIISVDNLVTKLLKVLRIIQMDNDNCIQQLIGNKNQLQLQKEDLLEQLRDREVANGQLKCDLQEVTNQLMNNGSELANSRVELQRHREEIDRLNEDICDLSTLCQNNTNTASVPIAKETILAAIEEWQLTKGVPEPDLMAHIVAACQEIPTLQEQLLRKEHQLSDLTNNHQLMNPMLMDNLQDAIVDTKRQYEAIDRALETLNSIQSLVKQCPALATLQRDLEETNFQSASTIPIYTALLANKAGQNQNHRASNLHSSDFNANPGQLDSEIINNGEALSLNTSNTSSSNSPGRSQRIDSTA